jgi:ribosomal protein S18 acetylase RimI-like enzyme
LVGKAKRRKRAGRRRSEIEVRQMTLEDLPEVWRLSEKIFTPSQLQFTYRTWNVNELLSLFQGDPELCLVAVDVKLWEDCWFCFGDYFEASF